jgi:hypothetical protein
MALSVIQLPPSFALAEHGLLCRVRSDKAWQQASNASILIIFPDMISVYYGRSFSLCFGGAVYKFTFVGSPDDSGFQLRMWQSDLQVFLSLVIDDLRHCYPVFQGYSLAIEGPAGAENAIRITARSAGSDANIAFTDCDIFGMTASSSPAIDEAAPDDYKILLAVLHEGAFVARSLAPPDPDGMAACDFAPLLRDMLSVGFTFPFNASRLILHPESVVSFDFVCAEHYNGQTHRIHEMGSFMALPGGLRQADIDLLADCGADYFGYMDLKTRFLNWCPDNKPTAWLVPERLYFLNYSKLPVSVKVQIFYGYDSEIITLATTDRNNIIYEILCGLHEIKPDALQADVTRYTVWVENSDGPVTETRHFKMLHDAPLNQRIFLFRNSFGVYESIRCTGEMNISDNISRDLIETADNRVYRIRISKSENNARFSIHTGWLDGIRQRRWLEDFLISKDVYWLQGDRAVPVFLLLAEIERESDRQYCFGLQFEFRLDINEQRFSNIVNENLHFLRDEDFVIVQDEDGFCLIDI